MPRDENIFYRLASGENATTELLCNFLQYAPFRNALFSQLFPGSKYSNDIQYEDIDTQFFAADSGRPDIVVRDSNFCAYIEVKIDEYRSTTVNQPIGYLEHLDKEKERFAEKWLAFLTPKEWLHRESVETAILQFRSKARTSAIKTSFFNWEDLICLIENNDLNRLNVAFSDFHKLLVQRYRPEPVKFTHKELKTMFTNEIPEALKKLDALIAAIEGKCRAYKISRRHKGRQLCPHENGIYFQNKTGQDIFFFGEWTAAWTAFGSPLCFGVSKGWPNAETFKETYQSFKEMDGWYIGLVPRKILEGENVVDDLWQELEPTLSAVVGQSPSV